MEQRGYGSWMSGHKIARGRSGNSRIFGCEIAHETVGLLCPHGLRDFFSNTVTLNYMSEKAELTEKGVCSFCKKSYPLADLGFILRAVPKSIDVKGYVELCHCSNCLKSYEIRELSDERFAELVR